MKKLAQLAFFIPAMLVGGLAAWGDIYQPPNVTYATGILPVIHGGTGNASGIMPASAISGLLAIANGGTGNSTGYAQGGAPASGITGTLAVINGGNGNGNGFAPGGAPASGITGTIAIANGGTNGTSFTSPVSGVAGAVYFDGTRLVNDSTPSDFGYNIASGIATFNVVSASGVLGVTNGTSKGAGYVGEYISSTVAATTTGLTTNVAANVTSITLTAGDWDVGGSVVIQGAGTTSFTYSSGGINTTSATLPAANLICANATAAIVAGSLYFNCAVPTQRINVTGNQVVYLVAKSTFTISTAGAGGVLWARRAI